MQRTRWGAKREADGLEAKPQAAAPLEQNLGGRVSIRGDTSRATDTL
jgi:hypothetical protein